MGQDSSHTRILVVDDERTIADTLALILKQTNYDARAAYSAEEAVELCGSFAPDVVLSDVVMGPMSGFDLAIYIAEQYPGCKVILMSGHSYHQPDVARSIEHGFEFLPKPVHPSDLLQHLADGVSEEP